MRVLLVEDHPTMRLGLKSVLEVHSDIEVVGEAENVVEALGYTREKTPEIVVLDLRLKGERSGIELCREIKSLPDPPRVVVYTAHNSEEEIFSCRLSGAESYVHKGEDSKKLVEAIRETHVGKRVWLLGGEAEEADAWLQSFSETSSLTPREKEVFALMVRGFSNARITAELSISPQTTKNYVSSIFKKLSITRREELF